MVNAKFRNLRTKTASQDGRTAPKQRGLIRWASSLAKAKVLFPLFAAFLVLLPLKPVDATVYPEVLSNYIDVEFELIEETPVSVTFEVVVKSTLGYDLDGIPLNIQVDGATPESITLYEHQQVSYQVLEPVFEEVRKSYTSRTGIYKDDGLSQRFVDFDRAGNVIFEGRYDSFDEKTNTFYWTETEQVGEARVNKSEEVITPTIIKERRTAAKPVLLDIPSKSNAKQGYGEGTLRYTVQIDTGLQLTNDGWGSAGIMTWHIAGKGYRDLENSSWWRTNWQYKRRIIIDATDVTEDLESFPFIVRFDDTQFDFNRCQPSGADFRFLDAQGTNLAYEIDLSSDFTTNALFYINIPLIEALTDDGYIDMYYGNDACLPGENIHDVWNEHYVFVSHMNDSPDGLGIYDSTSNQNHGTKGGAYATNAANILNGTGTLETNPTSVAAGLGTTTVTVTGAGTFTITVPTNQVLIVEKGTVTSVLINSVVAGSRTITVTGTGTFFARWAETAAPTEVDGLVGKAQSFDGRNNISIPIINADYLTIESLYFANTAGCETIIGLGYGYNISGTVFAVRSTNKPSVWAAYDGRLETKTSTLLVDENSNNYVAVSIGSTFTRFCVNGNTEDVAAITTPLTPSTFASRFNIGKQAYNAWFATNLQDETRISKTNRSSVWISYTDKTLRSPESLYAMEAEITGGGDSADVPQAPVDLKYTVDDTDILLTWQRGLRADTTVIVRKEGSWPMTPNDGVLVYDGAGMSTIDAGVSTDTNELYYRAWSYNDWGYSMEYAQARKGAMMTELLLVLGLTTFALWRKEVWVYLPAIIALLVFGMRWAESDLMLGFPLFTLALFMIIRLTWSQFKRMRT